MSGRKSRNASRSPDARKLYSVHPSRSPSRDSFSSSSDPQSPTYIGSSQSPTYIESPESPTYSRSSRSQTYRRSSQSPTYSRSSRSQTYRRSSQSPTYSRSSQSPTYSRSSQSPTYSRSFQSPTYSQSSQSPTYSRSSQSPTYTGSPESPTYIGSLSKMSTDVELETSWGSSSFLVPPSRFPETSQKYDTSQHSYGPGPSSRMRTRSYQIPSQTQHRIESKDQVKRKKHKSIGQDMELSTFSQPGSSRGSDRNLNPAIQISEAEDPNSSQNKYESSLCTPRRRNPPRQCREDDRTHSRQLPDPKNVRHGIRCETQAKPRKDVLDRRDMASTTIIKPVSSPREDSFLLPTNKENLQKNLPVSVNEVESIKIESGAVVYSLQGQSGSMQNPQIQRLPSRQTPLQQICNFESWNKSCVYVAFCALYMVIGLIICAICAYTISETYALIFLYMFIFIGVGVAILFWYITKDD